MKKNKKQKRRNIIFAPQKSIFQLSSSSKLSDLLNLKHELFRFKGIMGK